MKIAVASGKGGTGKTFVSTNLFRTLQIMGTSVSLVDCDAEVPNAIAFFDAKRARRSSVEQYRPVIDPDKCRFCGRCADYCSYNAIFFVAEMGKIRLLEDLCHGCGACEVACLNYAIKESSVTIGEVNTYRVGGKKLFVEGRMLPGMSSPVPVIKSAIRTAEKRKTDILIIDAPPGTSCPFIQTVAQADFVMLVTEPTPFGISDLRQAVETLKTMKKQFGVVINRAGIGNRKVYTYLEKENIPLLGDIPFDRDIACIYSEGLLVSDRMPQVKVLFENIANKLIQYGNSSNKR